MKRLVLGPVLAALALTANSAATQAAEVTLTLSHFLSPKAPPHARFLAPWAKKIEQQSKGRIKIEIFPSMSLGGKPPELYRQVRDGTADIVWTLTGYTPGVFPRVEVFELPGVHQGSAHATTLAIQDNMKAVAEDFKDIKPLLVHVNAGNAMHLVSGCIKTIDELKGKKLRTPSRTGAWMIESWGAEPVAMPVPDVPQALSKGTIDGALIPFEIVPPLKVHELTKCSVTAANDGRFGTSVFLFAMNKKRYDALPADLKAIIDANSGAAIANDAGKLWDEIEGPGKGLVKKAGSPILALDAATTKALADRAETVVQRWIKGASGVDGKALVAAARTSIARHGK